MIYLSEYVKGDFERMYSCGDFGKAGSIGIVCRGLSAGHLKDIIHEFDYCYIVGQFDKSLLKLGKLIRDKKQYKLLTNARLH